jgi:hypothetical protein
MANDTGGGYELPNIDGIYESAEAMQELNKLDADGYADDRHPLSNTAHLQHKDFLDVRSKLAEIAYRDARDPVMGPIEDALAQGEQMQTERVQQAEELMNQLVDEGFIDEPEMIPDDICAPEIETLEMALLAAREDWDSLTDRIHGLLPPSAPSHIDEAFRDYKQIPPSMRQAKCYAILPVIRFLRDKGRAKLGLPPRRDQDQGGSDDE